MSSTISLLSSASPPPSLSTQTITAFMSQSIELPDCLYQDKPTLIFPNKPTPKHSLYVSNLDDQKFLRFSIKYLFVYDNSVSIENLKSSLSIVLVDYYPLAGRLKYSEGNKEKLQVDCNGQGVLFAVASMDFTVEEFLEASRRPNLSWRKLLYRMEAQSFMDIPPLVIQVTKLSCGGTIVSTSINHCLCDGIGSSQFLHAWAHVVKNPNGNLPITPFHSRHLLGPQTPSKVTFSHPEFTSNTHTNFNLSQYLHSQPLVPVCLTFPTSHILQLKNLCTPLQKCTSFEALASHTWRCWIKSLNPPSSLKIKLLFSANIREIVKPELPQGYYGNGFVLGCAETTVNQLVNASIHHGVKLVQEAKKSLTNEYVRSMIDFLEVERVKPDLSASLVISQWRRLGFEELDFGGGKPAYMGPLVSEIYCLFLPVMGNSDAIKVLVSVPECVADKFEYYMMDLGQTEIKIGVEEHPKVKRVLIPSV